MRIVLLSGGSGKRLWPLSNEIRSKVFLKLLKSDDGTKESMIQRVCRQLDSVGLLQSTSIVTHESQVEITQNYVGDNIPILGEPYKKGTFTAIALAVSYFHSTMNLDPNETICVLPVDSFAETAFFQLIHTFPEILNHSQSEIALLGTVPKNPSNQYGYIIPNTNRIKNREYLTVTHFVEKPEEQHAIRLINNGALWNCGVFAFSMDFMLSYMKKKGLPTDYDQYLLQYEHLPELSFDQEVVERTNHSVVIPYDGAWKDLGSWDTLTSHFESLAIGSGQISNDSINTHLVNELPYPIQVIDVSNIIVAASPDGILVASKKSANQIKNKLRYTPQKPKYDEKRWGTCLVLDYSKVMNDETEAITRKVNVLPGKYIGYHSHPKRTEIWTIISGSGEFILNDTLSLIQTGDVLQISCGAEHAVKAILPLEFIEIQIGTELDKEDNLQMTMTWEDTIRLCKNGP
ncbi:sugar phosphate nucleotidyltransferase [Paenibacillus antarcticus]|uniref:Mannose-1-phosphate guanylyltransferase n=1 Tax=Paenibacillus antarcticus TaxID=253703 RepID=A0A168Q1I2_9BACL|nr:sugar phosphate nucleotidyltransferase [Paenibacillus antarcticus]OAB47288.1 mannose-1-phosphate guanylyltransferase [Paenibacillus antarcticus]